MTRLCDVMLLVVSLITGFLIPAAANAQGGAHFGLEIDVQIRMANGHPAPRGIHVVLDSAEGGSEGDCQTREGGKCELRPTSAGVYMVRVRAQGYQEAS